MNSLTLGFFYVIGLAWALAECCVQAAAGNSLPLVIYSIAFTVIFAIFGCLDLSDRAINLTGVVMAAILGFILLGFSCASWASSGIKVGLPKVLIACAFVAGSFSLILGPDDAEDEEVAKH